jgi:hypothetical protein
MSMDLRRADPALLRPQPSRRGQEERWDTPPCLRQALVQHVLPDLPQAPIWEPAAGSGELAQDLRSAGRAVTETDLFNEGRPVDFLRSVPRSRIPPLVITNPPFDPLDEWIAHVLKLLDAGHIAGAVLLLRFDHLGAACRAGVLNRATRIFICCWRPRWIKDTKTSPRCWFEWVVWLPRHQAGAITTWLTPEDIR